MPNKLGILAGGGPLPQRLYERCLEIGREAFVIAFEGQSEPWSLEGVPHAWVRLGAADTTIRLLREAAVSDLVMVGGMRRPSTAEIRPDWRAARILAKLGMRALGDDGLLTAIRAELETEGFRLVGIDEVLGGLLATPGLYGRHAPDGQAEADIDHGFRVVAALGALDIGQGAVVQQGLVLGVEAIEGTDALLERAGRLRREGPGGLLVKASKPRQDRRIDLPTIGPRTVEHAAAAGLRGIAIEAGGTLIIDADAVIERADRLGLFIMARDPDAAPPLFWLVAGEPSGDAIGASLMQALRERLGGAVRFAGIGGERMAAEGLTSLLPIRDLAIMGMLEVLPRARRILRWIETTAREIERLHPAAVVTIDSSGFCFRLGERLRRNPGPPPIIHYVAPMVWVWRGHRARSAARAADHLLTLLPFEPPYFEAVGLPATYVGHPVIESGADRGQAVAFRERHGLAEDALVISVLPGSRRTEVARLLPVFEATMRQIHLAYPSLVVLVPTVETVADQVEAALRAWPMRTILVRGRTEKYDGFAASKAALAASGTVSLELAMAKVPMVIAYKGWPPTIWLLRRLTKVPYATLVNILLKREAIPELLQDDCRPDLLVPALRQLIEDAPAAAAQRNAFAQALSLIGSLGDRPSLKAADCILALVEARRPPPDQALSPSGR